MILVAYIFSIAKLHIIGDYNKLICVAREVSPLPTNWPKKLIAVDKRTLDLSLVLARHKDQQGGFKLMPEIYI